MLTHEQVLHIAKLARLRLTEQEAATMQRELSAILEYVDTLKEAKTEGVPPTAQVTGQTMVTRPDEVKTDGALPDELLGTSPLPILDRQISVPSAHG